MLVDDEPDTLFTFLRVLRGTYDITLASSGIEALARIAASGDAPVKAVLVDFAMPGTDGATFVREAARSAAAARPERSAAESVAELALAASIAQAGSTTDMDAQTDDQRGKRRRRILLVCN